MTQSERNNRILIVDDNAAIHEDMRKILCPDLAARSAEFDELEAAILGPDSGRPRRPSTPSFQLDYAHQGQEGLALLQRSLDEGRPYAMAFVDMRMPPGWDGLQTTLELWKASPELQVVICTAYSDYSWEELIDRLGSTDRLVILKKPFELVEVLQLANALTTKWNLEKLSRANATELEKRVRLRTAELENINDALKSEIERRQRVEENLVRARDAAEAAGRAKSTFLANMSHEVRTPMNGVIGMANILLHTKLDDEQRDLVHTLTQCGESLLTIINDILDFSKVEAGKIALEHIEFDLATELALAIDLNSEAAAKKGVELVLDLAPEAPPAVMGDPVRFRQVLMNLVSNAIKFTEHGEIVVRVATSGSTGGRSTLRFEVADTGIGIAPGALAGLFEPFVQADTSMTRRFGGTGLGLAISRKLVETMGGTIGATSEPGRGSTFSFEIDFELPAAAVGGATSPEDDNIREFANRRLLVVDGNASRTAAIVRHLAAWGLPHSCVDSAQRAMHEIERAAAARTPFDVVVVDDSVAAAFAGALRASRPAIADPHCAPVVAAFIRGIASPSEREAACPATDFRETKPFNPRKLRTLLHRAFSESILRARPARCAALVPSQTVTTTTTFESKPRVLVVDDNAVNQKVAALLLRKLGCSVDLAGDGREALAALSEQRYGLVFMDAQMPVLDGFEATRLIRAAQAAGDPTYPAQLPIIALTAHAMLGVREECLAAGMDDYIAKPVRLDRLSEILAIYLPQTEEAPAAEVA
jgi:two-component system sensor histidine kinase/response regulator